MIDTLVIVVLIFCVLLLIMLILVYMRLRNVQGPNSVGDLKSDIQNLSASITQSQDQIHNRIDLNNTNIQANLHKQMSESAKLISDVTHRLTKLDETNKRVVDVADELKTLQNVLSNPKQRGVLGEYYLGSVLENALTPEQYKLQYKIGKGDDGKDLIVDAVIFLQDDKILPVDSKFSLENYNRLIETKDIVEKKNIIKQFKSDLKHRIDETSKYIQPDKNTMDFAFMFIPSEAIYYDLLVNKIGSLETSSQDLIEYAFREKRVIIVSPTSFLAYLQTVLQGLRSLQIEEQAKEIQKRVGLLGKHIGNYDEYMHKLGNSLGTTVNHYNTAHKELKKIDKDVVKIASTDPAVDALLVEKPKLEE